MQNPTIRKEFKCKFEAFERDSKHSNAIPTIRKGILTIQIQI